MNKNEFGRRVAVRLCCYPLFVCAMGATVAAYEEDLGFAMLLLSCYWIIVIIILHIWYGDR